MLVEMSPVCYSEIPHTQSCHFTILISSYYPKLNYPADYAAMVYLRTMEPRMFGQYCGENADRRR